MKYPETAGSRLRDRFTVTWKDIQLALDSNIDQVITAYEIVSDNPYSETQSVIEFIDKLQFGEDIYPSVRQWIFHPKEVKKTDDECILIEGRESEKLRERLDTDYYESLVKFVRGESSTIPTIFDIRMVIEAISRSNQLSFVTDIEGSNNLNKFLTQMAKFMASHKTRVPPHAEMSFSLVSEDLEVPTRYSIVTASELMENQLRAPKDIVIKPLPPINRKDSLNIYHFGLLNEQVSLHEISQAIKPYPQQFLPAIFAVLHAQIRPEDIENVETFRNALGREKEEIHKYMYYLGVIIPDMKSIKNTISLKEHRAGTLARQLYALTGIPIQDGQKLYEQLTIALGFRIDLVVGYNEDLDD